MERMGRLVLLVGLALVVLVGACAKQEKVLRLYIWSDYISPELVQRFEREFHCKVVQDHFESNEAMLARLKAKPKVDYDLLFPSSYMAGVMWKERLLLRLDHDKLPNLGLLDHKYLGKLEDATQVYSVPYAVGFTGIGYNRSLVKDFKPSWDVFGRKDLAGRMTMLNDMREALGAALKRLGYSLNSTDDIELREAKRQLLQWKKNLAAFQVDEANSQLSSEKLLVIQAYNGDILQLAGEGRGDFAFAIPVEGTSLWCDNMVVPKDAVNPDLALAFINFAQEPGNCALNMKYTNYLCPNAAAVKLLDPKLRGNPGFDMSDATMNKCEMIRDLGQANAKYVKIWAEVNAGE